MSDETYLMISLEDETEQSKALAEVLSSSTCKKIINYLSEKKEASQKDLSLALKIPMNTIEYNIKKLLKSSFIQKRKNFFWSKKGKKIIMYELSKKSVVISPKKSFYKKIKSITPAFILTVAGTFALWAYEKIKFVPRAIQETMPSDDILYATEEIAKQVGSSATNETLITPIGTPLWLWFLVGSLLAIFIISIVNWRKL